MNLKYRFALAVVQVILMGLAGFNSASAANDPGDPSTWKHRPKAPPKLIGDGTSPVAAYDTGWFKEAEPYIGPKEQVRIYDRDHACDAEGNKIKRGHICKYLWNTDTAKRIKFVYSIKPEEGAHRGRGHVPDKVVKAIDMSTGLAITLRGNGRLGTSPSEAAPEAAVTPAEAVRSAVGGIMRGLSK